LDDPVEDDCEPLLVTAGQRMGVLLRDPAVSGPARVPESGTCDRAIRARRRLEALEIADRADVVETILLEERDPGRVIAPVLEALEPVEQERFRCSRPYVSDDPAHVTLLPGPSGASPWSWLRPERPPKNE